MTLYIKNPKDSTQKLLELINKFSKVAGFKINIQKSVAGGGGGSGLGQGGGRNYLHFFTLIMKYKKGKVKKKIPFKISSKK